MPVLQQNVSTSIPAGPFVYSTDGFTFPTALTATNLTVNIWKNGAVTTYVPTTANWSTATPSSRGIFLWTLTTDAVDTVGNWTAYIYTTNCLPVREDYVVRSSNVEDFITGTSAPGTPASVWANSSRDLSTYAGLSSAVWQETTRALTTGGVVWTVSSRDLSTYAALSSAIWTFTSRNLTSYGGASTASLAQITTGVWGEASRTLTSWGGQSTATVAQITTAVWAEASRTITSWGGASTASVAQITTAVWAETVRSLTSFGHSSAVWSYTSRDLSTYAGLSSAVWQETTRALTTGGVVWTVSSRDLSTYAGLSSAVWQETTRSLTTAAVITSDIMNRTYDGALTFVQGMRIITGVLAGNSTGGGSTAVSFQNFGTTVARISYTVTTDGNRAVTTYSLTS